MGAYQAVLGGYAMTKLALIFLLGSVGFSVVVDVAIPIVQMEDRRP